MKLLRQLRHRQVAGLVKEEKDFYEGQSWDKIAPYQLASFNRLWADTFKKVPFYREKVDRGLLPTQINNWEDFSLLPIMKREFLAEDIGPFIHEDKKPGKWLSTGGSTGNPLQFPRWDSEREVSEASLWYARSLYGIDRSDKMFRLWGHSHLMGQGLSKLINTIKFSIGLPLVGYKRFPAYDLSEETLKNAGQVIVDFRPKYLVGYSKAISQLARANQDRKEAFKKLKLKAVFGAAEGFDSNQDRELVQEVFSCPCGLEYASMETSYLAYSHPQGGYWAMWKNFLIECVDEEGRPAESGRILVSSLYPKAFPLIRYELGDVIEGCKKSGNSVYAFEEIKGRDNDFLYLDERTPIHSEGITHAIKYSERISAYQIKFDKEGVYTIYLRSEQVLEERDFDEIRKRLAIVDPRLASISIVQVDQLKQTIAGKTRWLIEE